MLTTARGNCYIARLGKDSRERFKIFVGTVLYDKIKVEIFLKLFDKIKSFFGVVFLNNKNLIKWKLLDNRDDETMLSRYVLDGLKLTISSQQER